MCTLIRHALSDCNIRHGLDALRSWLEPRDGAEQSDLASTIVGASGHCCQHPRHAHTARDVSQKVPPHSNPFGAGASSSSAASSASVCASSSRAAGGVDGGVGGGGEGAAAAGFGATASGFGVAAAGSGVAAAGFGVAAAGFGVAAASTLARAPISACTSCRIAALVRPLPVVLMSRPCFLMKSRICKGMGIEWELTCIHGVLAALGCCGCFCCQWSAHLS